MVRKILKNISGIITFPPAQEKDIKKLSQMLVLSSFPSLPDDYYSFLQLSDGLIFNDIELYGCYIHKRKNYEFPNIEFVARLTSGNDFFRQNIIIGLMSEEIIVYNEKNAFYGIIDRVTLDYLGQYASFAELFKFLTNQQSAS